MSSESLSDQLQLLTHTEANYTPSSDIQSRLADKTLLMLIGATCTGKSTLMHALTTSNPAWQVVGTRVSRLPRNDDAIERYTYIAHTQSALQPVLDKIASRTVVQYTVNPSGELYWSEPEDYPGDHLVGDYYAHVVDRFTRFGFRTIQPVSIVTDAIIWRKRFDSRFPSGDKKRAARLREAITSLSWTLSTNYPIAFNPDGEDSLLETSDEIIALATGQMTTKTTARHAAEQLLTTAKDLV